MSEQDHATTSTAIEPRVATPAELMLSDDEIRRTYRVAEALARSGMWKDIKSAEAAFAKMVIGRDLGLTPAQAMQGVHIVEGGIQMHYAQLGQFVRARDGYDYRAGWIKEEPRIDVGTRDEASGEVRPTPPELAIVYHDEEEATDLRPVVGAFVEFYVDGDRRGLSRFTLDDARTAGLIKEAKPQQAWKAASRNMLLARSMSNGVKWFVPEVMAGMPVYVEGEIPARKSVTAPVGDGGDEGTGVDLGPKVEEIIERATRLGHRGLSNRGALELALGNRAPGQVNDWLVRAKEELDRFEQERAATARAAEGEGLAPDAPAEQAVEEPEEVVDAQVVPTPESSTTSPPPDAVVSTAASEEDPEVMLLRDRLRRLHEIDPVELGEEQAEALNAEIDMVEGKLREKGVAPEEEGR
jgi:hypothetical protein